MYNIDRLSVMEENERFTLQHLIDSMTIQENGNKEALYALQKKLKHGTNHQRLRVIEVIYVISIRLKKIHSLIFLVYFIIFFIIRY